MVIFGKRCSHLLGSFPKEPLTVTKDLENAFFRGMAQCIAPVSKEVTSNAGLSRTCSLQFELMVAHQGIRTATGCQQVINTHRNALEKSLPCVVHLPALKHGPQWPPCLHAISCRCQKFRSNLSSLGPAPLWSDMSNPSSLATESKDSRKSTKLSKRASTLMEASCCMSLASMIAASVPRWALNPCEQSCASGDAKEEEEDEATVVDTDDEDSPPGGRCFRCRGLCSISPVLKTIRVDGKLRMFDPRCYRMFKAGIVHPTPPSFKELEEKDSPRKPTALRMDDVNVTGQCKAMGEECQWEQIAVTTVCVACNSAIHVMCGVKFDDGEGLDGG